jgi:hypothetical protein
VADVGTLTRGVLAGLAADLGAFEAYAAGLFFVDGQWLFAVAFGLVAFITAGLAGSLAQRVFGPGERRG